MADTRTIVIVGGVAGGASAATRARRMNEHARIILLEKDEYVSFANCGLPYYLGGQIKDRAKLLVSTPEKFRGWYNIDVRTRSEVTAIDRARKCVTLSDGNTQATTELAYDKLILAPGASPISPPIPGMRAANVFTLRNLADTDRIKGYLDSAHPRNAVVIGAGFIGLEMVENLHHLQTGLTLVDLAPQVLPPLDPEMARIVEAELTRQGVCLHLGSGLEALDTQGDRVYQVRLANGTIIPADLVILAMGVRPNTALAKAAGLALGQSGGIAVNAFMQTADPDIYAVGDAAEYVHGVTDLPQRIPLAGPANRAGRIAGEHAATDAAPPMPAVLGTAIVRVFNATAGLTGLSQRQAHQANIPCKALWLPANHHVGYYPGAQEMILKVLYRTDNGRILGAQIVGGAGVDKRLDVIATAIRFKARIEDLADLDLTYAPPFGAAKDPIHLAGFIGQNNRRDLDDLVPPPVTRDLPPRAQVLDVRTKPEWQAGHLPQAHWIPLNELRGRLLELDATRPLYVVCRGGQRAYYAARILRQNGFREVHTVAGGMLMQGYLPALPEKITT